MLFVHFVCVHVFFCSVRYEIFYFFIKNKNLWLTATSSCGSHARVPPRLSMKSQDFPPWKGNKFSLFPPPPPPNTDLVLIFWSLGREGPLGWGRRVDPTWRHPTFLQAVSSFLCLYFGGKICFLVWFVGQSNCQTDWALEQPLATPFPHPSKIPIFCDPPPPPKNWYSFSLLFLFFFSRGGTPADSWLAWAPTTTSPAPFLPFPVDLGATSCCKGVRASLKDRWEKPWVGKAKEEKISLGKV